MHFKDLVQKQRDYFSSGATQPVEFRKQQLEKLKRLVVDNKDRYIEAIYKDLKRPKVFSGGEIDHITTEIDYFLANLDEWVKPEQKEDEPFGKPFIYKIPLGVILIISPFNFPISLALRPLATALAAGNTAILKPSELSENSANVLNSTLSSIFPEELVAVVEGDAQVSTALLQERYDHIFYTGSPAIGKIVMNAAARHLTPVTLELGGKCPAVVLDDTEIEKVAEKVAFGKYFNCGQICLTVDYILCEETVKDKLLENIKAQVHKLFGDTPKESPTYSRMINTNHFNRVQKLIKSTKGKLIYKPNDEDVHDDCYVAPRIYEVEKNDPLMDDEIFGPLLCVLPVKNLDEAIKFINQGEKPLGAYIFTEDQEKLERFLNEVHCGNAVGNGLMLTYGSNQIPFGGVGNSGMGSYHGKYGFDNFTHKKAVVKSSFFKAKKLLLSGGIILLKSDPS
ncbi:CBR-ALH-4 protein [Aphelenchoides bicaudatus]|nr:CBR-ALH-4 protein [Aphelenchoides bicaudatus]